MANRPLVCASSGIRALAALLLLTAAAAARGETRNLEHLPALGLEVRAVEPALASHLQLASGIGVQVCRVQPGQAAALAGLRRHDVITHLDGKGLTLAGLERALRTRDPGDTLRLRICRRLEPRDVRVLVGLPLPLATGPAEAGERIRLLAAREEAAADCRRRQQALARELATARDEERTRALLEKGRGLRALERLYTRPLPSLPESASPRD